MSKNDFILKAEGLHKSYRMGATEVKVLKGANLNIKKGEFVAIIGASGSGKSTLLHILGALDNPDRGSVKFKGMDLSKMSRGIGGDTAFFILICLVGIVVSVVGLLLSGQFHRIPYALVTAALITVSLLWRDRRRSAKSGTGSFVLNEYRNQKVGFVFQFYHLLDELSVLENVFLPAMTGKSIIGWLACRRQAKNRAKEVLAQMGLAERFKHKPYQLSGGERQRVAICRALMNEPRLLLADEPTGNLDSATGNGILDVLETLNRAGQTIVMVTHDERIAQRAGRTVTLVDGKIEHKNSNNL
jgi:ABC-type lipoprotein export system ATPase subunit